MYNNLKKLTTSAFIQNNTALSIHKASLALPYYL